MHHETQRVTTCCCDLNGSSARDTESDHLYWCPMNKETCVICLGTATDPQEGDGGPVAKFACGCAAVVHLWCARSYVKNFTSSHQCPHCKRSVTDGGGVPMEYASSLSTFIPLNQAAAYRLSNQNRNTRRIRRLNDRISEQQTYENLSWNDVQEVLLVRNCRRTECVSLRCRGEALAVPLNTEDTCEWLHLEEAPQYVLSQLRVQ